MNLFKATKGTHTQYNKNCREQSQVQDLSLWCLCANVNETLPWGGHSSKGSRSAWQPCAEPQSTMSKSVQPPPGRPELFRASISVKNFRAPFSRKIKI